MSSDKRLWAKVDLGYLSNPKMADVLDESSNAVLMHLASVLHCAQHLTDGHASPKAMQRVVGGSPEDAQLLIKAGLWHEPEHDCDQCPQPESGRIYVHNYLDHNVSSNSVQAASKRGAKAAKARWNKEKNAERMQDASESHAKRNARSDQIRSDQIYPSKPSGENAQFELIPPEAAADASEIDRFEEFWEAYPKRTGQNPKKPARQKFEKIIKDVDPQVLIDAAHAYARSEQNNDPKFIAQTQTWLNQERWNDEYSAPTPQPFDPWNTRNMTASQRRLQEGYEREQRILNGELTFDNPDNPYLQPRPARQAIEGGSSWTNKQP